MLRSRLIGLFGLLSLAIIAGKRAPTTLALVLVDRVLVLTGRRYRIFYGVMRTVPPPVLPKISEWGAVRASRHAFKRVPAYRDFIEHHAVFHLDFDSLQLPVTDKDNYVRSYPTEERCLDGRLTFTDTAIDESSGSSGVPHNWVRSIKERATSHTFISHFARYCYGTDPWITINAFSMGAWATGINMGIALQRNSLVKNTGPDVDKIFGTLEFFGPDYPYVICGYPPFLKQLIDIAKRTRLPARQLPAQGSRGRRRDAGRAARLLGTNLQRRVQRVRSHGSRDRDRGRDASNGGRPPRRQG